MKTKSPPAAGCPVPQLPEPQEMYGYISILSGKLAVATHTFIQERKKRTDPWKQIEPFTVAVIPLHRRPSKAQLKAVQALLSNDGKTTIDLLLKIRTAITSNIDCGEDETLANDASIAVLRSLGLHHKPGQHAGEKGKR